MLGGPHFPVNPIAKADMTYTRRHATATSLTKYSVYSRNSKQTKCACGESSKSSHAGGESLLINFLRSGLIVVTFS